MTRATAVLNRVRRSHLCAARKLQTTRIMHAEAVDTPSRTTISLCCEHSSGRSFGPAAMDASSSRGRFTEKYKRVSMATVALVNRWGLRHLRCVRVCRVYTSADKKNWDKNRKLVFSNQVAFSGNPAGQPLP